VISDNAPIKVVAVSALVKFGAFSKYGFLYILSFLARFDVDMDDEVIYCNCMKYEHLFWFYFTMWTDGVSTPVEIFLISLFIPLEAPLFVKIVKIFLIFNQHLR
jgi:hypothetical protein